MSNKSCDYVTVARNQVAVVQRCPDCGCVAVHVGPITVRLDERSLSAFVSVLGDAAAQLAAGEQRLTFGTERGIA